MKTIHTAETNTVSIRMIRVTTLLHGTLTDTASRTSENVLRYYGRTRRVLLVHPGKHPAMHVQCAAPGRKFRRLLTAVSQQPTALCRGSSAVLISDHHIFDCTHYSTAKRICQVFFGNFLFLSTLSRKRRIFIQDTVPFTASAVRQDSASPAEIP